MTTLRYKDYQGSVEFEDGHLTIQILHIDDVITTQVDNAAEAPAAFEQLVDDYVATCAEVGKEPCKPFKGSFNVRVTPELHRVVAMAAAETGESMNAWIAVALEAHFERQKSKKSLSDPNFILRVVSHRPVSRGYTRVEGLHGHRMSSTESGRRGGVSVVKLPPAFERQRIN